MKNEYMILIEKDEDGYYVGSIPALPGCHSQAKSVDQLMERMEEAITLWLEVKQKTVISSSLDRHSKTGSII